MLDGAGIDDAGVFNERLREREDFYDCNRPHGGLGGQTPHETAVRKVARCDRPSSVAQLW